MQASLCANPLGSCVCMHVVPGDGCFYMTCIFCQNAKKAHPSREVGLQARTNSWLHRELASPKLTFFAKIVPQSAPPNLELKIWEFVQPTYLFWKSLRKPLTFVCISVEFLFAFWGVKNEQKLAENELAKLSWVFFAVISKNNFKIKPAKEPAANCLSGDFFFVQNVVHFECGATIFQGWMGGFMDGGNCFGVSGQSPTKFMNY